MHARPLAPGDEAALRAFVETLPACHLALRATARRDDVARFVGAFDGERLAAVVYVGPGPTAIAAGDALAIESLARLAARRSGSIRRLVAEEAQARACIAGFRANLFVRRHLHMSALGMPGGFEPIGVERATARDLPGIERLQREFHDGDDPPEADPPDDASVARRVRAQVAAGTTWIARGDGVGPASAPIWKTEVPIEEPEGALLAGVVTTPARRREGVGLRALGSLVASLASRGVPRVTLHVAETNAPARGLYERLGFVADDAFLVGFAARPGWVPPR